MSSSPNRPRFSFGSLSGRADRTAAAAGGTVPVVSANVSKGVLMVLVSVFFFCITDSLAKYLTRFYPVSLVVWARFTFHLLSVIILLGPRYGTKLIRTQRPAEQVLRGLLLLVGAMVFITSLKYLPLAEASAIAFLSPLFVTLISVVFLKEEVGWSRWIAVLCGFTGVIFIIRPGGGVFTWWALLPIVNATTYAVYQIVTRRLAHMESPYTSIFYAGLVGCILLSVILPDIWVMPQNWGHALMFVAFGFFGATGHLILIKAYVYASASRLAPFSYFQLVWVAIAGFVVFDDFPDIWSLLGIGILVASGIFMMTRERRSERQPPSPPNPERPAAVDDQTIVP